MSEASASIVEAVLDEALVDLLSRDEGVLFPRDVALLSLRCEACERTFDAAFRFEHSPYVGQLGTPLYRDLGEALRACESLLERRDPSIEESDWERARRCSCEGPAHLVRAERVRFVRSVAGTGSTIVLEARRGGPAACFRVPHRGLPEPLDPGDLARTLGRPLTLFECWRALETAEGEVVAEPGVTLVAALDEESLRQRIEASHEGAPVVVVVLDASTCASGAWPPLPIAAHVAAGGAAAIVIERRVMLARLRAVGAVCSVRVEQSRPEVFELKQGALVGLVYPHRVARAMASYGLTLADACAHAMDETVTGFQRIDAFLQRVISARPGSSVAIEGGLGAIVRADGSRGPPFALESLPVHLEPGSPELDREIRYLCDPVPPWSDPTRVCSCGAPASLQRRLLPFGTLRSLAGIPEREPWVLETWTGADGIRAADVVVVACDLHRRIYPRRLLQAMGLDESALRARLARDRELASFALSLEVVDDGAGARAVVARGPLIASILLEPTWLAGLHRYAGEPLGGAEAEAWAFAPDGLCLLDARFREEERGELAARTAAASGLPRGAPRPFAVRVRADLRTSPCGRFAPLPPALDVV